MQVTGEVMAFHNNKKLRALVKRERFLISLLLINPPPGKDHGMLPVSDFKLHACVLLLIDNTCDEYYYYIIIKFFLFYKFDNLGDLLSCSDPGSQKDKAVHYIDGALLRIWAMENHRRLQVTSCWWQSMIQALGKPTLWTEIMDCQSPPIY